MPFEKGRTCDRRKGRTKGSERERRPRNLTEARKIAGSLNVLGLTAGILTLVARSQQNVSAGIPRLVGPYRRTMERSPKKPFQMNSGTVNINVLRTRQSTSTMVIQRLMVTGSWILMPTKDEL